MKQVDILLESEADAWFERNVDRLGREDLVTPLIDEAGIRPETAIEVGCSDGWRLAKWRQRYGARGIGVEPSRDAVRSGNAYGGVALKRGTADALPVQSNWANVLVYGFCLYLADPEDWLKIAAEGDRVLMSGGHLVIHDFAGTSQIRTEAYIHDERLLAYHFDFSRLWHAHPRYTLVHRVLCGDDEMITILKKNGMRAEITA